MYYWLWCTLAVGTSAIAEIILGLYGLSLPLCLATAFYFAIIGPWMKSTPLLLLAAFLIDSLSPFSIPVSALTILAAVLLAAAWRRHGDVNAPLMTAFPGFILGLVRLLLIFAANRFAGRQTSTHPCWFSLETIGGSLLLFPVATILFEAFGRHFSLRRLERLNLNRADEFNYSEEIGDDA